MLKAEIKNILEKPTWVLILTSTLFYVIGLFLFVNYVWSNDIYEINYTSETGFENYIDMVRRIDLVRYIFSPVYIISISIIIASLIKIGLTGQNTDFDNILLFKIVLTGTLILSLPLWVKAVWFVLVQESYNMNDVKYFYPFSLAFFFDVQDMHIKLVKAIGRINLYHLAFVLFVAWCIKIYSNKTFLQAFSTVIYTYGIGLLLLQAIIVLIFV